MRRAVRLLPLVGLLAGCASGPAGPLVVHPAEYDPVAQTLAPLGDGAGLHLQIPPQGGVVLFIGATVEGLGDAQVQLLGRLSLGGVTVGDDRRSSRFVRAGDAWEPSTSGSVGMANVPVCPAGGLVAEDMTATLEVEVTEESSGRTGSAVLSVVPRCQQSDAALLAFCRCACAADYMPGSC